MSSSEGEGEAGQRLVVMSAAQSGLDVIVRFTELDAAGKVVTRAQHRVPAAVARLLTDFVVTENWCARGVRVLLLYCLYCWVCCLYCSVCSTAASVVYTAVNGWPSCEVPRNCLPGWWVGVCAPVHAGQLPNSQTYREGTRQLRACMYCMYCMYCVYCTAAHGTARQVGCSPSYCLHHLHCS